MITLIYGSSTQQDFNNDDLVELLKTAKVNNDKLGITGILLYKSQNFLQVLEGEEDAVEAIYEKIKKDPRHYGVQTIMKRKIKQREFENWQMGFVNLDDLSNDAKPGYTNYLNTSLETDQFIDKPAYVRTFIANFKELMR